MKKKPSQAKYWAIGIIIVVIVIATIAIFSTQQKQEIIKIGGLFGLTGFASFAGEASRNGFILAIEDSGMNVSYVIEDYQSDVKTVLTSAKKLIEVDEVPVIIGPEWVEFGEVITPIANETKTLFISPWMSMELEWAKTPYYFTATPSERSQVKKMVEYMNNQSNEKVAIAYHNNAFSIANVDLFKDEVKKSEKIDVVLELKIEQTASDFRTEILKIKDANVDAIYANFATDSAQGLFSKQLKEFGFDKQVFLPLARAESDIFLDNFGAYANGMIYSAPKKNPKEDEFKNKYGARFGKDPTAISAATAYDMTTLVLQAMKNGARTSDEIRAYLLNIKNYNGYSNNNITLNEFGQVASQEVAIKQINGKSPLVLVE